MAVARHISPEDLIFPPACPTASLMPDERWLALGDSLTEHGDAQLWVEYFLRTRMGATTFRTLNAGLGGDTAKGARRRLSWDVLNRQWDVATLMFGMNDIGRHLYQSSSPDDQVLAERRRRIDELSSDLNILAETLNTQSGRLILLTPTPFAHGSGFEADDLPGLDRALSDCAEKVLSLGHAKGIPVVHVHADLSRRITAFRSVFPNSALIMPDRVHLTPAGQFALALTLMDGLSIPSTRREINLDAATSTANTTGTPPPTELQISEGQISFRLYLPSLPFAPELPDTPAEELALLAEGRGEDILRIEHLSPGKHRLQIDDVECGIFTCAQLSTGIPLAHLDNFPVVKDSKRLLRHLKAAHQEKAKLRALAWSEYHAFPEGRPDRFNTATVETRLKELQKTVQPTMHAAIQRRLDVYATWKQQEPEIQARIETAEKTLPIPADAGPSAFTIIPLPQPN